MVTDPAAASIDSVACLMTIVPSGVDVGDAKLLFSSRRSAIR
jgi:hypothetical protein